MLKKEESNMAIIKGDPVENATTYELYEVTSGGYTVTCKGGFNSNDYPFYVDGQRVYNSDGDQVFTGVSTIRLADDGNDEAEYAMDDNYNTVINEGETLTLTRDVTIAEIAH